MNINNYVSILKYESFLLRSCKIWHKITYFSRNLNCYNTEVLFRESSKNKSWCFYLNIVHGAGATHYLYHFFVSKSVSWLKLTLYGLPLFQYIKVRWTEDEEMTPCSQNKDVCVWTHHLDIQDYLICKTELYLHFTYLFSKTKIYLFSLKLELRQKVVIHVGHTNMSKGM